MPSPPPHPKTGWGLVRRAFSRHKRRLWIAAPFLTLWQLCEVGVPIAIGLVVDYAIVSGDAPRLALAVGGLIALFLTLSISYQISGMQLIRGMENEQHQLRLEIADHVLRPEGSRTDLLPGEIGSLATSDAALVPLAFRHLAYSIAALGGVVLTSAYVLRVDLTVGLLVVIGVPLVLGLIQLLSPMIARRTLDQQARTATTVGLAGDIVHGLRPLKGVGGERVALRRYRDASQNAVAASIGLAKSWGTLAGLTSGLAAALLAVVTLTAALATLDGRLTIGQLVAIVGLTQLLAEPLGALGEVSAEFARSRAAAGRIAEFLHTPPRTALGHQSVAGDPAHLTLTDVHAGALRGTTLEVAPGQVVALVVADASQADSLASVLSGDLPLEQGSVTVGGTRLEHLTWQARRDALTVAPHHAHISEGTLRSVIDPFGRLDPDAMSRVLQASAAADVVALHPDGLERSVRAGGTTLSGGQRQRLAVAAALAIDAPLLVLNDPTSAVDAVTEQAMADGLVRARRVPGRSTLIVTSSPALLQAADRVHLLVDGRVVAHGTHHELMARDDYRDQVIR